MRDYKLYCLDGAKRIYRAADVICAITDEDAIAQARSMDMATACEIWDGRRLVATIGPSKRRSNSRRAGPTASAEPPRQAPTS